MRLLAPTLFVIAAAASSAGCTRDRIEDAGPKTTRAFPVGNFSQIAVAGSYDVRVRTGGKPGVTVTGPKNILDHMEVEVDGNRLEIHPKKEGMWGHRMHWGSHDKVTVDVVAPTSIEKASIAGSGDMAIDKVAGNMFDGSIAGSGSLGVASIDVQELKLSIAGSGDVTGSGKAQRADHSIAGSGSIDLPNVTTQDLKVSIAGSGDVATKATGTADISIMGSGDVTVTGGAKCNVHKMGSGSANCS
jgi:hypothetical protein